MFHTLAFTSLRPSRLPARRTSKPHAPRGTTLGVAAAALAIAILTTGLPGRHESAPAVSPITATLTAPAGMTLPALRDASEGLRASLLTLPGAGSVTLSGVQTGGLQVIYAPSRLAELGIQVADLQTAMPTSASAPGRLTVRSDAAQEGPQAIANLPVRAGHRVFRLGDVAIVARTLLDRPVSTLSHDGHPAIRIGVVPAPGTDRAALANRVTAALEIKTLPGNLVLQ